MLTAVAVVSAVTSHYALPLPINQLTLFRRRLKHATMDTGEYMSRPKTICLAVIAAIVIAGAAVALLLVKQNATTPNPQAANNSTKTATPLLKLLPSSPFSQPADDTTSPLDWPMFHAQPSLRGLAGGKLGREFQLAWRFKTGAIIEGSPAVADGRVFIGSRDKNLYAINLADGKELWRYATGGNVSSTPCVAGGRVFFGSEDTNLYCLNAADGKLIWKYATDGEIHGSPTIATRDGAAVVLIGSYDKFMHCVSATDGKKIWTFETDNYINGAAAVAGQWVVFGGCDAYVYVVSLADGSEGRRIDTASYI
ncbi:MAG: hypothetical protein EHM48_05635, partial [Planctomycetaceae bacterium]